MKGIEAVYLDKLAEKGLVRKNRSHQVLQPNEWIMASQ